VPKLPRKPSLERLKDLSPDIHTLKSGLTLWRIYFRGGPHPTSWSDFRNFGPLDGRFDHHFPDEQGDPTSQTRGMLYGAEAGATCFAEVFQRTRVIDRFRREPWLVAFELATPLKLLDLTGSFATRAGASMALMTGPRAVARRWAQTFYEAYPEVQGVYYPSSMYANAPAIALNERAVTAGTMPSVPSFHRALADNALHTVIRNVAREIGYKVV
jgi:hypothetical protein